MKRRLAILTILLIAVVGLWGCGQDDGPADATTIDSSDEAVATTDASAASEREQGEAPADVDEAPSASNAAAATEDDVSAVITILGDADFTAANGVVGGSGTAEDPYVIAALDIIVPPDEAYGVRIENVTAHFVLRGVIVQGAAQRDGAGIRIGFANGGALEGCSVSNSVNGIDIISSTDITMENCVLYTAGRGLRVIGESEEQYRHQISDTNQYNNSPIYYYYGLDGETISGLTTGHLTVAGSRNVTISHNEVVNGDGLLIAFVEDSTISSNLAHRLADVATEHGITLYSSNNNDVYANLVKNNRLAGIQLTLADGNRIHDNFAYVNDTGIRLLASDGNEVTGNDVYANVTAITLLGSSSDNVVAENTIYDDQGHMTSGILLEAAFTNTIERNLIFGSQTGIALEAQALNNTVAGNTVVGCGYGIYLSGSNNVIEDNLLSQHSRAILFPETFQETVTRGNTLRGNVLAENGSHVYTNMDSTQNTFTANVFMNAGRDLINDQGDGNLWSADGVGNFYGLNAVEDADGDGIGDEPMTIYPSGVDDTAPLAAIDANALGLGVLGTLDLQTVTIEGRRGRSVDVDVRVADEVVERRTGFRGFPAELIDGFPGILFVFDEEQDIGNGFIMLTVPFDLDIVFFDAEGEFAGSTTMTAQTSMVYTASAPYWYALELPSGSLEALGIDENATLVSP